MMNVIRILSCALVMLIGGNIHAQVKDTSVCNKQVDSLIEMSRSLSKDKKFTEAYKAVEYAESITIACLGKDNLTFANCIFNRGRVFHLQNKFAEALPFYQTAMKMREKLAGKESKEYSSAANNTALVLRQLNRLSEAIPLYKEVADLKLKQLGADNIDYAAALNNYGVVCYKALKYDEVEKSYLEVRRIREKVQGKKHQEYARILNNLAAFYVEVGRYEEAEKYYLETKTIQEGTVTKQSADYATTLNNLGLLYKLLGKFEESELLLTESNSIREKVLGNENAEYAEGLYNLAGLHRTLGDYKKSIGLQTQAVDITQKLFGKNDPRYGEAISNLALAYYFIDEHSNAENLYIESKNIFATNPGKENKKYTITANNLALYYIEQKKYEDAFTLLNEVKDIRNKTLGLNHPDYANVIEDLSLLNTKKKNYTEALTLRKQALDIFGKSLGKEHERYAENLHALASLEAYNQNFDNAQIDVIGSTKVLRKVLFNSTRHLSERELFAYNDLFLEQIDLNYSFAFKLKPKTELLQSCYDNALFYKGFLLNSVAQIRNIATSHPDAALKIGLLNSYKRRIIAQQLLPLADRDSLANVELENKSNIIEKELARTIASYKNISSPITSDQIGKLLKPDEAAIEFVKFKNNFPSETDSVLYAAILLKGGTQNLEFIVLFEAKEMEKLVGKTIDRKTDYVNELYSLSDRGAAPNVEPMKPLYDLIWKPLESKLQTPSPIKTVYLSNVGLLHRINLAAIPVSEEMTMGEKYHLVMLNSTRQLASDLNLNINPENTAIIFGGVKYDADSTFLASIINRAPNSDLAQRGFNSFTATDPKQRGGTWTYLKWTDKEANSIENVLKTSGFTIKQNKGYEATEEAFKQIGLKEKSPRVIHIATHGYFFPDPQTSVRESNTTNFQTIKINQNPMIRSGLILAGANYAWLNNKPISTNIEDGILTASEISLMNLANTELVVLSACETGLGDIVGNEGVYGLQRAFKIAGAKYLIMSLWQVPDFQTQELMTTFYGKWLQDKMSIPDAFRATQHEMREKYQSPWFWAGFVLVE